MSITMGWHFTALVRPLGAAGLWDRGWRLVAPLVQTANSCEALRGHSMNTTGI